MEQLDSGFKRSKLMSDITIEFIKDVTSDYGITKFYWR